MKQARVYPLFLLGAIAAAAGCERPLTTAEVPAAGTGAEAALPSTSPNPDALRPRVQGAPRPDARATPPITFSEFPLGTSIGTQYADRGVTFGGSGPFITTDGANPTSPVLSGTPRFQGHITGTFVRPGTSEPAVVESFTLDAGYFDEIGSTRIEWFDPDGKKLGQQINSRFGIERITVEGGNIASWRIGIVETEPAGFAVDNVSFTPVQAAVLFRERADGKIWMPLGNEIPGFDHAGILVDGLVYESHPGHSGTYVSADGSESVQIVEDDGVQWQFTLATFRHDSPTPQTRVTDFEQIPVDSALAQGMKAAIESVGGSGFNYLSDLESLSPARQKGSQGTFTCVGLLEWAAEQAGHNGGRGFIPNAMEGIGSLPLLSPELLNYAMKSEQLLRDAKQWIKAYMDPVDFIIVDPLGRRLGHANGVRYDEIPHAFYSGDAALEQVLIPATLPGPYTIQLVGRGADALAAVEALGASTEFSGFLAAGQTVERVVNVPVVAGGRGDVDGDGDVDLDDVAELRRLLNQFTPGLGHPGDLDGDGLLSEADVELLLRLIEALRVIEVEIDVHPGSDDRPFDPQSQRSVLVAILGSARLDVTTIDRQSLAFGPAQAPEAPDLVQRELPPGPRNGPAGRSPAGRGAFLERPRDLNRDGFLDVIAQFRPSATGLSPGDTEACLTGSTTTGLAFRGCDTIRMLAR